MSRYPRFPEAALEEALRRVEQLTAPSNAVDQALRMAERLGVGAYSPHSAFSAAQQYEAVARILENPTAKALADFDRMNELQERALEISSAKALKEIDERLKLQRGLELPTSAAMMALDRFHENQQRLLATANAWKAIEDRTLHIHRLLDNPALDAIKAAERMNETFNSFRNLAAHIPSFDAGLRAIVANLAEADEDDDIDLPAVAVGSVIVPDKPVQEGILIQCTSFVWTSIVRLLKDDWNQAFQIPPRVWEEIIAGAFHEAGFHEVVLTPRSGDHGRDVIAVRQGIGSVRILGSVKAYKPGHLITKEEVHALMGVVSVDPNASKGLFATTSDFAPRLLDDPRLAATVPHRIELMNGARLQEWLKSLAAKD